MRVALDSTREAERRMRQAQAIVDAAIALAQSDGMEPKDRAAALETARKALADQETIARGEPTRRLERALLSAGGPAGALAALSRSTAATAPTLAAVQGRSRRRGQVSAVRQAELAAGRRASEAAGARIPPPEAEDIARSMALSRDPATAEAGLRAEARRSEAEESASLPGPVDTETLRAKMRKAKGRL